MVKVADPIQASLLRQVNHWLQAATRMSTLDHLASANAWHGIDKVIGIKLRDALQQGGVEVITYGKALKDQLEGSPAGAQLRAVKRGVIALRDRYLKAEETIHFYTVAVNSRTTPTIAALLRACDVLSSRSMQELLQRSVGEAIQVEAILKRLAGCVEAVDDERRGHRGDGTGTDR